jgi:hypothetical protein
MGAAVGVEVVRGAEDRVTRVVDVPAEAVGPPGGGDELHGPLRAGDAVVPHLAERRLDEVDRGEELPPHAEPPLRRAVPEQELLGSRRLAGPRARPRLLGREPAKIDARLHVVGE